MSHRPERLTRVVLYSGPDSQGRYHYSCHWMVDYHPGHPDGEYRTAERGQHSNAELPDWYLGGRSGPYPREWRP